jgi:hypothetical protein
MEVRDITLRGVWWPVVMAGQLLWRGLKRLNLSRGEIDRARMVPSKTWAAVVALSLLVAALMLPFAVSKNPKLAGLPSLGGLLAEHVNYRNNLDQYLAWRWGELYQSGVLFSVGLAIIVGVMAGAFVLRMRDNGAKAALWPAVWETALGGILGAVVGGLVAEHLVGPAHPVLRFLVQPFAIALCAMKFGFLPTASRAEVTTVRGTTIDWIGNSGRKALDKAIKQGRTVIAGVPIEREFETRHFAFAGATGTGKSTAIRELMLTSKMRGDRQVIADPDGGYLEHFYVDGDAVLNPFDARCLKWDFFAEIEDDADYKFMAESILPLVGNADIDQWNTHAHQIIAAAAKTWHEHDAGTTDEFIAVLASGSEEQLALLCEGTPAARYFADGNERMLGSILATMPPALDGLVEMTKVSGRPFSIRQWIREGKGSMFLPYKATQIASLRSLISCWMRIAIFETLSLSASQERRMWFFVDELEALGKISGLTDAQTRIRKFGGCVVMGFQSIAQLRRVYGDADANTIIENCGNKLYLRCESSERGGTAQFVSEQIGEREIERVKTTNSESNNQDGNSTSTSTSTEHRTEKAVLPSQIMQLADRTGYLKLANVPSWMYVEFDYTPFKAAAVPFMPRRKRPIGADAEHA